MMLSTAPVLAGPGFSGEKPKGLQLQSSLVCQRVLQNGDYQNLPSCDGVVLKNGDRLTFVVSVDQPAFVYAVTYNSQDPLSVLFPNPGEDNFVQAGQKLVLPPGGWVRVEGQGGMDEVVFVVASVGRLRELEDFASRKEGATADDLARKSLNAAATRSISVKKEVPEATVVHGEPVKVLSRIVSGRAGVAATRFVIKHAAENISEP